jgi:hypothetical protein
VFEVERESNTRTRRRRLTRIVLLPLRLLAGVVLRMVVTCVVFIVCAAVAARLLGYELPGASDLEKYLEGIEQLSDVLS